MMDFSTLEPFYGQMRDVCVDYYKSEKEMTVFQLAEACMDLPGLPMHCPPHHFLMPAVLLTACHKAKNDPVEYLEEDLDEACKRAHNVLGGFCGNYGSCGSAVGVGIFMSIFTQSGPCSQGTWAWTNMATANALTDIAKIDGPRCCKRNTYLALLSACDTIAERLNITLEKPEDIVCKYHAQNKECKGTACPFFRK
ncbi:MAG: DUF5714 domain-containing protein [Lachnospiraceae bacterium]|nr:DUF5714 domain-containing protein [Lachnospiraceae bacterium]